MATITDMQGREVYRFALDVATAVDVRSWPAGIYQLRLPNGRVVSMVKQ